MKENEIAFLSQVALGVFTVDAQGNIWRHRFWAGSKAGSPSTLINLPKSRRAERAISQRHLRVMFTVNHQRYAIYAHRAVWLMTNLQPIPEGLEINHKDGNPKNNHPQNLEVVTRQENTLHAGRVLGVLGKKAQRGENNASAKLTTEQVMEIRQIWKSRSMTQATLAERYSVSQGTISAIVLGKSWTHLPIN